MTEQNALLSPLATAKIELRHRIGLAGRVTNLSEGPGLSDQHLAYFKERLKGGVSVLINDPVVIHPSSQTLRTQLSLDSDDGFSELILECQAARVPAIQPLLHVGAHGCAATAFHAAWSPSGMPSSRDQDGSHMLSEAEIEQLLDSYVTAAVKAKQLGFSGVEIIAGGDMLPEQFWNARSNHRRDCWGGGLTGRMRFSTVLIERLRQSLGATFLIGLTMTSEAGYGTQLESDEMEQVLSFLVDHTDCDYYSFCLTDNLSQLQNYRSIVGDKLFVLTGALLDSEQMIHLQSELAADWLALDKALLADPHLPVKLAEGAAERIRPCVSCHQQCNTRIKRDIFVSCLVNPGVGNERQLPEKPSHAEKPQRLLVVGGGLAGMESARYAAQQGHQVTLIEQQDQLGGSWSLAARIPGRDRLQRLIDWFRNELDLLGVTVKYGVTATAEMLDRNAFDQTIIATGADQSLQGFQRRLPNFNRLPGLDNGNVFSVEDVLADKAALPADSRILILDDIGNWQGLGTALYLSGQGYRVTVVSRHAQPAPELGSHPEYDHYVSRALQSGVEWINDALLMQWHGDGADLFTKQSGKAERFAFDALVLATTLNADRSVEQLAVGQNFPHTLAGDCQGSRRAHMAVYEGRLAARNLSLSERGGNI